MVLKLDTTAQLRRQADLVALVRAIVSATDDDETAAIEWKSGLDLESKAGQFLVAKNVLGMANRDPARAIEFEGWAYMVIGASPGNPGGAATVDPSVYVSGINEYVGDALGPAWRAEHVQVDGNTFVVVHVDPPRDGDQPWPLRKEYTEEGLTGRSRTWQRGTIFARRPGRTEQATDADIDMLAERSRAATESLPDLDIGLAGDLPLPWLRGQAAIDRAERWIDELATGLKQNAAAIDRQHQSQTAVPEETRAMLGIAHIPILSGLPDGRSLNEYGQQVDRWRERARRGVARNIVALYTSQDKGKVQLLVANRSNRYMKNVQLRVHFDTTGLLLLDRFHEPNWLPPKPRLFGEFAPLLGDVPNLAGILDSFHELPSRTWKDASDIVFDIGDLRPRETDESDPIGLVLAAPPDGGKLDCTWHLTAEGMHAVIEGTISIDVAAEAFEMTAILDAELGRVS